MQAVKIGTSWRIRNEWGGFEGFYMTKENAEKGIAKKFRDARKAEEQERERKQPLPRT